LNRKDLQQLSTERLEDARALLAASRWSAAYYLAGYSVECALKACILARIERTGVIFQDKKFAEKCWTHDLEELVKHSGLSVKRDKATGTNANLERNWSLVKDWDETSRYRLSTEELADKLFNAIDDKTDGVLPWIRNLW